MNRAAMKKSPGLQKVPSQLLLDFARAEEKQHSLTHAVLDTSRVHQKTGDTWYFAYGSNMSVDQKQRRTGTIRRAMRACLRHYRLAFNKEGSDGYVRANILNSPGGVVWGVAYLCNRKAMDELDRCEGVRGGHYCRCQVTLEASCGDLQAEVYIAGPDFVVEEDQPTKHYLDAILSGAREHGLPDDYIDAVENLARNPT